MTPAQLHLVTDAPTDEVEYRIGRDGKKYPTTKARRSIPAEERTEVDKATSRLAALVERHGPDEGVRRWSADLDPDVARVLASIWGIVAARRLAEQQRVDRAGGAQ